MILYHLGSPSLPCPSLPCYQAEKIKAATHQHLGSQSSSPIAPFMQISNTQERLLTSEYAQTQIQRAFLALDKSKSSHQREVIRFSIKAMLGQEAFSFNEANLEELPSINLISSNFEKFYRSNMVDVALNAQAILLHLKALLMQLKALQPEQLARLEDRKLKKSIYATIVAFFKAGVEYQRISNILFGENIVENRSAENIGSTNDGTMQNNKEIDKMLFEHLFSYRVICHIKNIFPNLQPAEILKTIRDALEYQPNPIANFAISHTWLIPDLQKSEILQHRIEKAYEAFLQSFDTELSPSDLKTNFAEFLYTSWGVCFDYRFHLQSTLRKPTKHNDLQKQFKLLSQRLLSERTQEIAASLVKNILQVKYNHDLLKTQHDDRNWLAWQMQIEIAHSKIQEVGFAKILDCYEAHKKRKERWSDRSKASAFTEAEINELSYTKRKIIKHTNQLIREINKTLSKHRKYVNCVLYILKEQGSIDLNTLLFLAEQVNENGTSEYNSIREYNSISEYSAISQYTASERISKGKRCYDQQTQSPIDQPAAKRNGSINQPASSPPARTAVNFNHENTLLSLLTKECHMTNQSVASEAFDLNINLDFDTDLNIDIDKYLEGDFNDLEDLETYI